MFNNSCLCGNGVELPKKRYFMLRKTMKLSTVYLSIKLPGKVIELKRECCIKENTQFEEKQLNK